MDFVPSIVRFVKTFAVRDSEFSGQRRDGLARLDPRPVDVIQPRVYSAPQAGVLEMNKRDALELARLVARKMLRAARLDEALYGELGADGENSREAVAAVAIVSVACGFGTGFAALLVDGGLGFFGGLLLGVLTSAGGWLIWALWSYWFGTAVFWGPRVDDVYRDLGHKGFIRSLAFANSPRVLGFFLFIPYLGWAVAVLASVWALVAGTLAARRVFDLTTRRALVTCAVGWTPYTLFVLLATGLTI